MSKLLNVNTMATGYNYYDFIISGGGMIGSTLACALGKSPLLKNCKILLIENSPKASWTLRNGYSNRVSAINPKSKVLFENLGLWKHIEAARYKTVNNIKVWGKYSNRSADFSLGSDEELAYVIENDLIIHSATKELSKLDNVTVKYETNVKGVTLPKLSSDEKKPELVLQDDTRLMCGLLIGADGANSLIRKSMNVKYLSWDYKQFGIVATLFINPEGNNSIAWQKFLPNGPIALLPLSDGVISLVWSTSHDEAKQLLELTDESFVDAINSVFGDSYKHEPLIAMVQEGLENALKLLKYKIYPKEISPPYISNVQPKSRAKFPLSFGHSSQYCSHRVCIVGDAAHKVHPLAGQGVNLGFHDIECLAQSISEGIRDGRRIGSLRDLKSYEAASLKHNIPVMAGIDLFHRLFVTDSTILKAIGNSSFIVAEAVSPLKSVMRSFASN